MSSQTLADLCFCRICLSPQCQLMIEQLKVSSSNFDREQLLSFARTGARSYRVLWSHENVAPAKLLQDVNEIMDEDFSQSMPLSMQTRAHAHLLFRMLARVGASAYHFLFQRHLRYPFRLFKLLVSDPHLATAAAEEIMVDYVSSPCILDDFSKWWISHWVAGTAMPSPDPDPSALLSKEALSELRCIASEASIDIASTECCHASNRRLVESKSLHTHATDLSQASSQYIARCLRSSAWIGFKRPSCVDKKTKQQKRGRKPRLKEHQHYLKWRNGGKSLRRGGGGWNSFVAERKLEFPACARTKLAWKQGRDEYRQLPEVEKQKYQMMGFYRTQAQRSGVTKIGKRTRSQWDKVAWCKNNLVF